MKLRILIAVVLVLLIAEFAYLAFRLPADYEAAAYVAQQQEEEILHRTQQLEQKQDFLNSSKSDKALALEFSDVEEQYNYYVEVCNELKKGIETVQGYIAGN